MDKEKLIRVVRSKKPLWDRSNKFFRNRDHTKELWKEVAEEMDEPCDVVKKKWTGLRDVFRREWKHIYAARVSSGDGTVSLHKKSTWPYLENMLFLAPQMVFHEPVENQEIKEELDDSMGSYPDELPFEAQFEEGSYESLKIDEPVKPQGGPVPIMAAGTATTASGASASTQAPPEVQKSPADLHRILEEARDAGLPVAISRSPFKRPPFADAYCVEVEEKRARYLESSDSDQQFLMSLLPFLKAIPGNRKMSVRMRLQQVFLEEEERASQNHPPGTTLEHRKSATTTSVPSSTWVSSNSVSSPTVD
nr:PREDICTED: uncharacterized protein LOC109034412 [Bemisia tabaci]